MDVLTLAMAKSYTDSKQLGHVEPALAYKWDGDRTGRARLVTGVYRTRDVYKISDTPADLNNLTEIKYSNGETLAWEVRTIGGQQHAVVTDEWGDALYNECGSWVVSADDGLYVCRDDSNWVSCIRFGDDVIHTIDKRLIPPLDSITLNGADGNQYKLTIDTNGQLQTSKI